MKIVLMEPLGVSSEIIERLADGLRSAGHAFTSYDSFTTDTDELIRRAGDADILPEGLCQRFPTPHGPEYRRLFGFPAAGFLRPGRGGLFLPLYMGHGRSLLRLPSG